MNLNALIARRADPGVVVQALETRFEVGMEEHRPGWFDLQCRDRDADRLRLVVRYQWWPMGWKYFVIPVRHRPRRAWPTGETP